MRIGIVHTRFGRYGGAEGYALRLAAALAARGHDVHTFGRRAAGLPDGVTFHPLRTLPLSRAVKANSFARAASRAIRPSSFDIVQGLGRTTCQTVHRASGGLHRSYLGTVAVRRLSSYDRVAVALEDALFASDALRAIICPSARVARDVARFYPSASPTVHVIPNGVDTAEFTPEGRADAASRIRRDLRIPAHAPLCLFVATNFWLKGLDIAVRALSLLPAAHLVVVGGDRSHPFRALAQESGVVPRLHFAGRRLSLAGWYRGADVLLHPTRYDPCSNVCLEAAACGTPIVTTRHDGVSDLFENGDGAIAVESPAAPGAVAQAASMLLADGPGARQAARRLAERHTQEAHVDAVERLYRDVARQGGGR